MGYHILYGETHYEGAHRDWIDSYVARSQHQFTLLTMPGGDWRWRLHGGAIHLAQLYLQQRESLPPVDLVMLNAMVNAPLFLSSTRPYLNNVPVVVYFQENQLTYPPPPDEPFLWQNGASINVISAYVADMVGFNGPYLRQDFLTSLKEFLDARGDYPADIYERVSGRTAILLRGIDLQARFGTPPERPAPTAPITFLWSHRWAAEKGIEDFAFALRQLHAEDVPFQVILAGTPWTNLALRDALVAELGSRVLTYGLLEGEDYAKALRQSDVMVACSQNEPLGVSMLEAIYMGCLPLMPARGSFPVILPPGHHDLLYDGTRADLVNRMRHLATHPEAAYRPGLSAVAAAYDWSQVIQDYDRTLADLIRRSQPA